MGLGMERKKTVRKDRNYQIFLKRREKEYIYFFVLFLIVFFFTILILLCHSYYFDKWPYGYYFIYILLTIHNFQ